MQTKNQCREGKHKEEPEYDWVSYTGRLIGRDEGTLTHELNRLEKTGYEIWDTHPVRFRPEGKDEQSGVTIIARKRLKNGESKN